MSSDSIGGDPVLIALLQIMLYSSSTSALSTRENPSSNTFYYSFDGRNCTKSTAGTAKAVNERHMEYRGRNANAFYKLR